METLEPRILLSADVGIAPEDVSLALPLDPHLAPPDPSVFEHPLLGLDGGAGSPDDPALAGPALEDLGPDGGDPGGPTAAGGDGTTADGGGAAPASGASALPGHAGAEATAAGGEAARGPFHAGFPDAAAGTTSSAGSASAGPGSTGPARPAADGDADARGAGPDDAGALAGGPTGAAEPGLLGAASIDRFRPLEAAPRELVLVDGRVPDLDGLIADLLDAVESRIAEAALAHTPPPDADGSASEPGPEPGSAGAGADDGLLPHASSPADPFAASGAAGAPLHAAVEEPGIADDGPLPTEDLLTALGEHGVQVVVLDPARDGLEQVDSVLGAYRGVAALHLVSHGGSGSLRIGSSTLDGRNLSGEAERLAAWGRALAPGGDVLLYGCEVGAGQAGIDFVERLAHATGADVAASDDPTGAPALGGDTVLEVVAGAVETAPLVVGGGGGELLEDPFELGPDVEQALLDLFGAFDVFTGELESNPALAEPLPLLGAGLGALLSDAAGGADLAELLGLRAAVQEFFDGADPGAVPSADDLVAFLRSTLEERLGTAVGPAGSTPLELLGGFDADAGQLRFELSLDAVLPTAAAVDPAVLDSAFAEALAAAGVEVSEPSELALEARLSGAFSFGLDLTEFLEGGGLRPEHLFVEPARDLTVAVVARSDAFDLEVVIGGSQPGSSEGGEPGSEGGEPGAGGETGAGSEGVTARVVDGSVELRAAVSLDLTGLDLDGDGRLDAGELQELASGQLDGLLEIGARGGLEATLPLDLSLGALLGVDAQLSEFGTPTLILSTDRLIALEPGAPEGQRFSVTSPDVILDLEINPELEARLRGLLDGVDALGKEVLGISLLGQEIPGLGRSLNDLLGGASGDGSPGAAIQLNQAATHYFDGFGPGGENEGGRPTLRGLLGALQDVLDRAFAQGLDPDLPDHSGLDLRGVLAADLDLSGFDFRGSVLRDADFSGANLRGVRFDGADLRGADLSGAFLRGASFAGADLRGADLSGAWALGVDLSGALVDAATRVAGLFFDSRTLWPDGSDGGDGTPSPGWSGIPRLLAPGLDLSDLDLSGFDLSGFDLSGLDLSGLDLAGAGLSGASLRGVDLSRADLRGADLSGALLAGARLGGALVDQATRVGGLLFDASTLWPDGSSGEDGAASLPWTGAVRLLRPGIDLSGLDLSGFDFSGLDLTGIDFSGANLRGVRFFGADLSAVSFGGGEGSGGASLFGADLRGALGLAGIDLSGLDLRGVDLRFVDLSGADLSGVNLSGARLSGADLSGVDLSGARLVGAEIVSTLMDAGTKLAGAVLDGLQEISLEGLADLTGTHVERRPDPFGEAREPGPAVRFEAGFDVGGRTLSLHLVVDRDEDARLDLSLGTAELDAGAVADLGVALDLEASVRARLLLDLGITFGIDLSGYVDSVLALEVPSIDAGEAFFGLDTLRAAAAVGATGLTAEVELGGLGALAVQDGQAFLTAEARVELLDPNGDGRLTLAELPQNPSELAALLAVGSDAVFDVLLPVGGRVGDFDLDRLGSFLLRVVDEAPFDATPPTVELDVSIAEELATRILDVLRPLDEAGETISGVVARDPETGEPTRDPEAPLNRSMPLVDRSLNDLLKTDMGGPDWGDFLRYEDVARDYFDSFAEGGANEGAVPTLTGLARAIEAQMQHLSMDAFQALAGGAPFDVGIRIDLDAREIALDLAAGGRMNLGSELLFGALGEAWEELGIRFEGNVLFDLLVDLGLEATLGLGFAGGLAAPAPFLALDRFDVSARLSGTGSELGVAVGPVAGRATAERLELAAEARVGIAPGAPTDAAGRVDLGRAAPDDLFDLVVGPPAGSSTLDALFRVDASALGTPLRAAGALPSVALSAADFFRDPVVIDADLGSLTDFSSLGPADLLRMVVSAGDFLDQYRGAEAFSVPIPFTGATLGDAFDFGLLFARELEAALVRDDGSGGEALAFSTVDEFAARLETALGLDPGTLVAGYDPELHQLRFEIDFDADFPELALPLDAELDLGPLGAITSEGELTVAADAGIAFTLGFDLAPDPGPRELLTVVSEAVAASGRLADPVRFELRVGDGDFVLLALDPDETDSNDSLAELARDLTGALAGTALEGRVAFEPTGAGRQLAIRTSEPAERLEVRVAAADAAVVADALGLRDGLRDRAPGFEGYLEDLSVEGRFALGSDGAALRAALGFVELRGALTGTASSEGALAAATLRAGLSNPLDPDDPGRITFSDLLELRRALSRARLAGDPGAAPDPFDLHLTGRAGLEARDLEAVGLDLGAAIPGDAAIRIDLVDPDGPDGELDFTASDLRLEGSLTPADLLEGIGDLSFADILRAISAGVEFATELEAFPFLTQKLPAVDLSLADLAAFADDLADVVERGEEDPAGSLGSVATALEDLLREVGVEGVGVGLEPLFTAGGTEVEALALRLHLEPAALSEQAALLLDLETLAGLTGDATLMGFAETLSGIADLGGAAALAVEARPTLDLDLAIDPEDPGDPVILDSTALHLEGRIEGRDLGFRASLGPLSTQVTGASVILDTDGEPGTEAPFSFRFGLAPDPDGGIRLSELTAPGFDLGAVVDFATTAVARAEIPLPIGPLSATVDLDALRRGEQDAVALVFPDPTSLFEGLGLLEVLSDPTVLVDGVDALLGAIESGLGADLLQLGLPIVGDALAEGADFIGEFRAEFLGSLRGALEEAGSPLVALQEALFGLFGPGGTLADLPTFADTGLLLDVDDPFSGASGPFEPGALPNFAASAAEGIAIRFLGDPVGGGFYEVLDAPDGIGGAVPAGTRAIQIDLHLFQAIVEESLDLAFDLGLPAVPLALGVEEGEIRFELGWDFELGFGVTEEEGLYLATAAPDEIELEARITLPDFLAKGTLFFLDATARDIEHEGELTHVSARFTVDLLDPALRADDGRLAVTGGELSGRFLRTGAAVVVDLNLGLSLGVDAGAAASFFPSLVADLHLDWSFERVFGGGPGDPAEPTAAPLLRFLDVGLDLGRFFRDLVEPVLGQVDGLLGPVAEVFQALDARIPALSDVVGEDISFLDLPAVLEDWLDGSRVGFSVPGVSLDIDLRQLRGLTPFLDTLRGLVDLVGSAIDAGRELEALLGDLDELVIPFGEFTVGGDLFRPGARLAAQSSSGGPVSSDPVSTRDLDSRVRTGSGSLSPGSLSATQRFFDSLNAPGAALQFPLFAPSSAFRLLLGQDVDIVRYTLPSIEVDIGLGLSVEIPPPPIPVPTRIDFSVSGDFQFSANFGFGFDTAGVRQFSERVRSGEPLDAEDFLLPFDGFFLRDWNDAGEDVRELSIGGNFGISGGASLAVVRGSASGSLEFSGFIDLNDPTPDGKLRITDIARILGDFDDFTRALNLFNASVQLGVDASVSVDVWNPLADWKHEKVGGVEVFWYPVGKWESVWSNRWDFLFVDWPDRPAEPALATDLGGGVLRLNMGPAAAARGLGNTEDGDEVFAVSGSGSTVAVTAFGITQIYEGVTRIVGDGGLGNDQVSFSGTTVPIEVRGGEGSDRLEADATTSGPVTFDGDAGDDVLVGGGAASVLRGGEGADRLTGRDGRDRLEGGPGDDLLEGGGGDDELHGGEGVDALRGGGGADVLLGDAGDDDLAGGAGADRLEGGPGADLLAGDADDDELLGGTGSDRLEGGPGNDLLLGGDGDDLLEGADGMDRLEGGAGSDAIHGGTGADLLLGGEGADLLLGGTGDDELRGGSGADRLEGEAGSDRLFGDAGGDELFGGDGDDELRGGLGADRLFGGDGGDTLFGGGDGDRLEGGLGADRLFGGTGDDELRGGEGADLLRGEDGPDRLFGESGADDLAGGAGDDALAGGGGDDRLAGDAGDDRLVGEEGDDRLEGGVGDDVLEGGAGRDLLFGDGGMGEFGDASAASRSGDGADRLDGGGDVDLLFGGGGADLLDGGTGADVLFGDAGSARWVLGLGLVEGRAVRGAADGDDELTGGSGDDAIFGGGGDDRLDGGEGRDALFGDGGRIEVRVAEGTLEAASEAAAGDGADTLAGGAGGDLLLGGGGDDELAGDGGRDLLVGDHARVTAGLPPASEDASWQTLVLTEPAVGGADVLRGGPGNDLLIGGARGDSLAGDAGDDILLGDSPAVTLEGGEVRRVSGAGDAAPGEDVLLGGGGRDLLVGGGRSDRLAGGSGDDLLLGDGGVVDLAGPAGGAVVPRLAATRPDPAGASDHLGGEGGVDVLLGGEGGDVLLGGDGDDVAVGDGGRIAFAAGVPTLVESEGAGPAGGDRLVGGPGGDALLGGLGSDDLDGGAGDDALIGDGGRVRLASGAVAQAETFFFAGSPDRLVGGPGLDLMLGGAGSDLFIGDFSEDAMVGDFGRIILEAGRAEFVIRIGQSPEDLITRTLFDLFNTAVPFPTLDDIELVVERIEARLEESQEAREPRIRPVSRGSGARADAGPISDELAAVEAIRLALAGVGEGLPAVPPDAPGLEITLEPAGPPLPPVAAPEGGAGQEGTAPAPGAGAEAPAEDGSPVPREMGALFLALSGWRRATTPGGPAAEASLSSARAGTSGPAHNAARLRNGGGAPGDPSAEGPWWVFDEAAGRFKPLPGSAEAGGAGVHTAGQPGGIR